LILADFGEIFSNARRVEPVTAKLGGAVEHHRHVLAVARFERLVGVDVDDIDVECHTGLQGAQAREQLVAEVAVRAAVDGQDDGIQPSTRNGM
jgi:hypothetical protein